MHFTPDLLAALDERGIERVAVTLHVGAGTFLPVKVDDTRDHKMHAEQGLVSAVAVDRINAAGRPADVSSPSAPRRCGCWKAPPRPTAACVRSTACTDIFITPGYRFRAVDLLMTNFHLPRSTLFMLVAAFAGLERMKRPMPTPWRRAYRFYSYGDACLLHREDSP